MKVWVLYISDFGDPDTAIGVYTSEDLARAALNMRHATDRIERRFTVNLDIRGPFDLDAPA